MSLAAHEFSDLLLFPEASYLKGCPGEGQKLIAVPDDCREELAVLAQRLPGEFMRKRIDPLGPVDDGTLSPETFELASDVRSRSIRIEHEGIHYRVAVAQNVNGELSYFLRRLPAAVPSMESLGLPEYLLTWLMEPPTMQGLVLISGAQCCGKTTTASSLAAGRLARHGGYGLTLECPAELPLEGRWGTYGFCSQTEISSERELSREIVYAHRYGSPNVILIGEIRTKYAAVETLRIAQGSNRQVVIATVFGLDLLTALSAFLRGAKELDGESAGDRLANCLLCVIHQDLHPTEKGHVLRVPDFLLCPFTEEGDTIRRKIREGTLKALADDIKQQKNRVAYPEWLARAGG